MSQPDLLRRLVEVLNATGIDYMLTGSLASSLQGEPRATHDIDLVVQIEPAQLPDLIRSFPAPSYYLSEDAPRQAVIALRVYEVQYGTLDLDYLERWAQTIGVEALLDKVRAEAEPL